jgi:hypothetical protein
LVLSWDRSRQVLRDNGYGSLDDDAAEKALNENGWEVLYTYEGA